MFPGALLKQTAQRLSETLSCQKTEEVHVDRRWHYAFSLFLCKGIEMKTLTKQIPVLTSQVSACPLHSHGTQYPKYGPVFDR